MNSKVFLEFYQSNKDMLIFGDLRPVKSITRNIISGVTPFVLWYRINLKTDLDYDLIAKDILKVNTNTAKSTVDDNIKNLIELKFIEKIGKINYQLTRNFIDFINSRNSLSDHIIFELKSIKSIADFSMLYNYILSILREGLIYEKIIDYPDSFEKFKIAVPDISERKEICKKVYNLYGFSGPKNDGNFDGYTPNIIYRNISTCTELGLVEKTLGKNRHFKYYQITKKGVDLINTICENLLSKFEDLNFDKLKNNDSQEGNKNLTLEEIYDRLYLKQSEEITPDEIINLFEIDLPKQKANQIAKNQLLFKRDPKKAANAKKIANYKCEFDSKHETFISNSEKIKYVEAHHIIPMSMQNKFYYSLDTEANLVALCPLCHATVHRAVKEQKYEILKVLYERRVDRLKKCNLLIDLKDLIEEYE